MAATVLRVCRCVSAIPTNPKHNLRILSCRVAATCQTLCMYEMNANHDLGFPSKTIDAHPENRLQNTEQPERAFFESQRKWCCDHACRRGTRVQRLPLAQHAHDECEANRHVNCMAMAVTQPPRSRSRQVASELSAGGASTLDHACPRRTITATHAWDSSAIQIVHLPRFARPSRVKHPRPPPPKARLPPAVAHVSNGIPSVVWAFVRPCVKFVLFHFQNNFHSMFGISLNHGV